MNDHRLTSAAKVTLGDGRFGEPTIVCVKGTDIVRVAFGELVAAVLAKLPARATTPTKGERGPQGPAGQTGAQGPQGIQGETGDPGTGADILVDVETFEVVIDADNPSVISDVEVAA